MSQGGPRLFRQEALEYYAKAYQREGDVLRISPAWTRWTFWVLLLLIVAALLFAILAAVPEYAEGPAVIWIERTLVTANAPGTVESVEVEEGDHVRAGDVLVRFYSAQERAELDRIKQAFELQLINSLRNPLDQVARQALTTLRTQRELAEARLRERCVRAPRAGVVGDVRIREGQYFAPGDTLVPLTPSEEDADLFVFAMLPARYRPKLRDGMQFRLELAGYRYDYETATIDWIEDEALGPSAIRRYLGQEIADAVSLQGPVVLVRAPLERDRFEDDGHWLKYYHGMQGTAAVSVDSESVLSALVPWAKRVVPWFKALFSDTDG